MKIEIDYKTDCFMYIPQQIEDVLRVIERITPVIGLWREKYKVEKRLEEINNTIIETNGKKAAYSNILQMKPNKTLTKAIESEVTRLDALVEELLSEQEEIEGYSIDIRENIGEYNKYIHSFDWLYASLLGEVLSKIDNNDKPMLIATLLLFTNSCIKEDEKSEIFNTFYHFIKNDEIKFVLTSLTYNENAIFDYMSTRDIE